MTVEPLKVALGAASDVVDTLGRGLAARCAVDGRLSRSRLDDVQPEAFAWARLLAERAAARALLPWAETHGDLEKGLAATWLASFVRHVADTVAWQGEAYGWTGDRQPLAHLAPWVEETLATPALNGLAALLHERSGEPSGALGLGDDHQEMQRLFARFADERIVPLAEEIHRHDQLIPEPLLQELAELGVFGISIPEEYGGSFVDHLTMCLATEELSRGSLGAGGSVITRPEICAKAILKGGTEEQKKHWLPRIATAQTLVSVAVTEPNAGSDVAAVRVSATRTDGGWLINGEKTWCTFAGRADAFILLARTGDSDSGHRGLTLFLAEKPAFGAGEDEHGFLHRQDGGGSVEGHAIPTIGYRGMHSYAVAFDNYFVPEENRIGEEGRGFILQMQGFAGGRIQTAARAVGVMEAAFRKAVSYAAERQVFGRPLADFSMTGAKLALMAATLQASRQLSYHVAHLMDDGGGDMEASLVKLLSCKDAEWLTREAMQLHGGMGYSEEYAVSRYWQDARVLSIFEGAEEVLALYVVARAALGELVS